MFEIGNIVSFFSLDEEFNHFKFDLIEEFIEGCAWYEIIGKDDPTSEFISVRPLSNSERLIPVMLEEYQIHTKESLRNRLNSLKQTKEANKKYGDVCNKVIQLYRKHNRTDSQFKFQGV